MTVPNQDLNTNADVAVTTGAALTTSELDDDWKCDIDGARLEVEARHVVGSTTYQIRLCSANPTHMKMIPV